MGSDKDWQKRSEEYTIQGLVLLEQLYANVLPWMTNLPIRQLYSGDRDTCPSCGGKHIQYRGDSYTNASKFRRFRCESCGSWGKSPKAVDKSNLRGGNV